MKNTMRVRRAELEISQLDVALQVGVSHSYISQVERGYVEPSEELQRAIARALKTTPEALFPTLVQQPSEATR